MYIGNNYKYVHFILGLQKKGRGKNYTNYTDSCSGVVVSELQNVVVCVGNYIFLHFRGFGVGNPENRV